jgi:hypothetical protein
LKKQFLMFALLIAVCAALFACASDPGKQTAEASPSPIAAESATPETVSDVVPTPEQTAEPTLAPVPTPSPTPTPAPTEEPTPTPVPEPSPFTILWIADTQNYAYKNDAGLISIVDYALKEKDELNIIAVLHTGDIVENNAKDEEWEKIRADVEPLRGVIPFYSASAEITTSDTERDRTQCASTDTSSISNMICATCTRKNSATTTGNAGINSSRSRSSFLSGSAGIWTPIIPNVRSGLTA